MVDPQYVAFFRDPLYKLVSAYLYNNKHRRDLTTDKATDELYEKVKRDQNRKIPLYHERYSSYLLTPDQKQRNRRVLQMGSERNTTAANVERNVALMKQNLVDLNVMIGVVERMNTSLLVLQHSILEDY